MSHDEGNQVETGLKVWADVGLSIGSQVDRLTQQVSKLDRRLQITTPVNYRLTGAGYFATGSPLLLQLGSPDEGTLWSVQAWLVGGVDGHTTAAGKAVLYAGGYNADAGGGMLNAVDLTGALPYANHYGPNQVVVRPGENLWASITGGTNAQQYVTSVLISVFDVRTLGAVGTVA